ncbi:hypothetical protein CKO15_00610 [Halorhodospira abdelmalekii]|uniref:HEAT repeat domain-containing protein n=1 Tax=Halorhodospira abdelmalekii TaxID=421629 RepID=UPI001904BD9D|nr:HEAT repeat domain-containing protein [Halorhodospira abdelmalekii]MBK1733805.1 hypothetical protein [Halorhodospira abdelmalekii]
MTRWKKPLANLFQPRWRNPDPEQRRQAAIALSITDPESDSVLAELSQDPEAQVREAAVKRLRHLPLLRGFLHGDPDPGVRTSASARYRQMLLGESDTRLVERELYLCDDSTVRAHVAQKARWPQVRLIAIRLLEEPGILLELALNDPEPGNRLYALERITDPQALEAAAFRARNTAPEVAEAATARLAGERPPRPAITHPSPAPLLNAGIGTGAGDAGTGTGGGGTRGTGGTGTGTRTGSGQAAGTGTGTRTGSGATVGSGATPPRHPARFHAPPTEASTSTSAASLSASATYQAGLAAERTAPADPASALCCAMEGLANGRWSPGLHNRRRRLISRWRALDPTPGAALQARFHRANKRALLTEPGSNSVATDNLRQLERLLRERVATTATSDAIADERLTSLIHTLRVDERNSEHPETARAYRLLQRTQRYLGGSFSSGLGAGISAETRAADAAGARHVRSEAQSKPELQSDASTVDAPAALETPALETATASATASANTASDTASETATASTIAPTAAARAAQGSAGSSTSGHDGRTTRTHGTAGFPQQPTARITLGKRSHLRELENLLEDAEAALEKRQWHQLRASLRTAQALLGG